MIHSFEDEYQCLIRKVMECGEVRQTRNGMTTSSFGHSLDFNVTQNDAPTLPLLHGRKSFYKGIFGELAAIVRGPNHIDDFTFWGCNYWDQWAEPNGNINVDYGNQWNFGGQMDHLKECLRNDRTNRRMLINAWRPDRVDRLSLPCCHYNYQFYVRNPDSDHPTLDMLWCQRSVDVMVGLPADAIFAAAWLMALANEFGMRPGRIKMDFGDCHIYRAHNKGMLEYLAQLVDHSDIGSLPTVTFKPKMGVPHEAFQPDWITIEDYYPNPPIKFEVLK